MAYIYVISIVISNVIHYLFRASAGSKLALGWELQKGSAPFESDIPFKK